MSVWSQVGCLSGAASVALGAFGAHGLKSRVTDPAMLATWNTAAQYHLIHSVMLTVAPMISPRSHIWSVRLFSAGITLFSGSLYAIVLTNQKKFGAIAPIGGSALIAGWIALALRR
jgi:uncharacterized membrane protein YgdD (TMEM256/DUF423 family)